MSIHLLLRRRGALAAALVCTALALSACGGDSKTPHVNLPPGGGGGGTPPPVASDSFFDYVLARVNTMLDHDEPAAIDSVTETRPEDTEPKPLS